VVDHTGDNTVVSFRFKNKDVKMLAAEDDLSWLATSSAPARSSSLTPTAPSSSRCCDLGLSAWAVASVPSVKTHDLTSRIGYVHS
jgi:hypothetical protein